MSEELNPEALAESGDSELDEREGVQEVTEEMIYEYVKGQEELPAVSALPFSAWLYQGWNEWNEDGTHTNGDVIAGALGYWRGE